MPDVLADLARAVDKIEALERLERDQLLALAATGATDELIAATAIGHVLARWVSTPPPGSLGWGATPADLGAAVVGALRLCGRIPKTENENENENENDNVEGDPR